MSCGFFMVHLLCSLSRFFSSLKHQHPSTENNIYQYDIFTSFDDNCGAASVAAHRGAFSGPNQVCAAERCVLPGTDCFGLYLQPNGSPCTTDNQRGLRPRKACFFLPVQQSGLELPGEDADALFFARSRPVPINFVNDEYSSILQIKCIKYLDKPLFQKKPFVNTFSRHFSESDSHIFMHSYTKMTLPLRRLTGPSAPAQRPDQSSTAAAPRSTSGLLRLRPVPAADRQPRDDMFPGGGMRVRRDGISASSGTCARPPAAEGLAIYRPLWYPCSRETTRRGLRICIAPALF